MSQRKLYCTSSFSLCISQFITTKSSKSVMNTLFYCFTGNIYCWSKIFTQHEIINDIHVLFTGKPRPLVFLGRLEFTTRPLQLVLAFFLSLLPWGYVVFHKYHVRDVFHEIHWNGSVFSPLTTVYGRKTYKRFSLLKARAINVYKLQNIHWRSGMMVMQYRRLTVFNQGCLPMMKHPMSRCGHAAWLLLLLFSQRLVKNGSSKFKTAILGVGFLNSSE